LRVDYHERGINGQESQSNASGKLERLLGATQAEEKPYRRCGGDHVRSGGEAVQDAGEGVLALEEHPQPEHREVDADHVPVDEEQEEERRRDDNVLQDSILASPDESTHLHGLIDQEEARYRKEGCGGEIVSVQDGIGQDA